jgi:hypothetical protein
MQNRTDQAEASIPTATNVTNNGTDRNRTVNVRRQAAKRTHPFDLTNEELNLVLQEDNEDIPARKKPRLEEPLPTTKDEATRETASPEISVVLSPHAAENDGANADADPVTDTQPNTGATGRWTLEEDAKLTRAVSNTSKKKWRKEYTSDWAAISALIPGRTQKQCRHRWNDVLGPSIGRTSGRKGKWKDDEDSKLKDAVQTHGDKDWVAISLLVPTRTKKQCWHRWHDILDPSIDRTSGRIGKWTAVEDSKLKDAVLTHGDKVWVAISLLVPGRTRRQCLGRWHAVLDANTGLAISQYCRWTAIEDKKLKNAVQTHGDKGWAALSALVPGRTGKQCWNRWKKHMDPNRSAVQEKCHRIPNQTPALG